MLIPMKYLDLTLSTANENLALDEALLDVCAAAGGKEILRVWEPREYFVVLGYSSRMRSEVNLSSCHAARIPVLRRCSGGGTVFGPKTRDWSYHMPAKAKRVATRTALLGKLQDGEVVIADLGEFSTPSAKAARKILADLGSPARALVVLAKADDIIWRSFRNFPGVKVRAADDVCAHDVVSGGLVIAQAAAIEKLAARVGRTESSGGAA